MKPPNEDRRELLEDIFAPDRASDALTADAIARLIAAARQARYRRRCAAGAALLLAAAGCISVFWPKQTDLRPSPIGGVAVAANVPVAPVPASRAPVASQPVTPPSVERVDDQEMLAMLRGRPAALVRWPDGRQSLVVLNTMPRGK